MRLATVGSQKEQKHFKCSRIFMLAAFDEFTKIRTHQVFSVWDFVFCITFKIKYQLILLRLIRILSNITM